MVLFVPGFFQDSSGSCHDHGVGCDDEGGVGDGCHGVPEGYFVDIEAFHGCGLQDVFERREGFFGEVFGFLRGSDFEIGE